MASEIEPILGIQALPSMETAVRHSTAGPGMSAAAGCSCGGSCGGTCPGCAAAKADQAAVYVYALGRVRPRIPNLGLEKEIAQAASHQPTKTVSDEEALCKLLVVPRYEYIAREMCWLFTVQGVDAFVLKAEGNEGLKAILDTLRPDKGAADVDVIIGRLGPRATMTECNGAMLPTVATAQVYSFDRSAFAKVIPRPKEVDEKQFDAAIKQTLDVVGQMAGNFGVTDGHRALNYIVTRYAQLYELVAHRLLEGAPLSAIVPRPSTLTGGRRVIEVVLTFRHRETDVASYFFTRVDVSDIFPFLVTPLSPYFATS